MQFPKIITVEALQKYKLDLRFSDGTKGIYDVEGIAGKGVFKTWDVDENFFKVFISESGAISWPGEIDIDTINAYCTMKKISPENYFQKQMKYATDQ